ncbi:MAG: DMT family transporter [Anaerovoracaceae bacterium]
MIQKKSKGKTYLLMILVVILWGYEYVPAKHALELMDPMTIIFLKYFLGLCLLLGMKLWKDGTSFFQKRDIPLFIACAIFGELLYFWSEYSAMHYMPVSLITIVLSFVPVVSFLIERVAYGVKANGKIYVGVAISIVGIALIVGADFRILLEGRIIGYLLAFFAVLSWNIYNFATKKLAGDYPALTLTVNQLICTVLLSAPIALGNMPPWSDFTPAILGGIMYLGLVSAGIGFLLYVKAIAILGPTPTALFSNFLPVTATFFGWVFLQESIGWVQLLGGVIVIIAGSLVIREKGRLEITS